MASATPAADTPRFSLTPEDAKTKDVQRFIRKRLAVMSFEINPGLFFDSFLPFSQANSVLEKLSGDGLYEGSKWKNFPTREQLDASTKDKSAAPTVQGSAQASREPPPAKRKREEREQRLYKPFIDIANAITKASIEISAVQDEPLLRGRWVDMHNRSPALENPHADKLRPDVCFVPLDKLNALLHLQGEAQEVQVKSFSSV
jgi:hypothetical protein